MTRLTDVVVGSAHVHSVAYEDGALTVVFKNGSTYRYEGVTPIEWSNLQRVPSVGKYLHAYIIPRHKAVRL
ncbi:MAG: KTSC domain-containing protein [Chloroflexota bacterium]|nr:KTSC domain-containing protein [Chloroflexota bacterium]